MFVIYCEQIKNTQVFRESIWHLQFKEGLYVALTKNWHGKNCSNLIQALQSIGIYYPIPTSCKIRMWWSAITIQGLITIVQHAITNFITWP